MQTGRTSLGTVDLDPPEPGSGGVVGDAALHLALNKPRGHACSHNPAEGPIVDDLLPRALRGVGLEMVGRLDRETSGLLLLTTDGALNHRLAQPLGHVEKEYRVGFRGRLRADAVRRCAAGFPVEGFEAPTRPARLVVLRPARPQSGTRAEALGEASLTLREGRHHQVRRMFRALGARVVTLHRARIGGFALPEDLAVGAFVELDAADLASITGAEAQTPRFERSARRRLAALRGGADGEGAE